MDSYVVVKIVATVAVLSMLGAIGYFKIYRNYKKVDNAFVLGYIFISAYILYTLFEILFLY